jgi:hypothetical protein
MSSIGYWVPEPKDPIYPQLKNRHRFLLPLPAFIEHRFGASFYKASRCISFCYWETLILQTFYNICLGLKEYDFC